MGEMADYYADGAEDFALNAERMERESSKRAPQDSPTPQQIAEARVEPCPESGLYCVRNGSWFLRHSRIGNEPGPWRLYDAGYDSRRLPWFSGNPSARAALAAAQERAGVYPRPPGATCECVKLWTMEQIRQSSADALPLTSCDRKYAWVYDGACPLCTCGVPKSVIPGAAIAMSGRAALAAAPLETEAEHAGDCPVCNPAALPADRAERAAWLESHGWKAWAERERALAAAPLEAATPDCSAEMTPITPGSCWMRKADGRLFIVFAWPAGGWTTSPDDGWWPEPGFRAAFEHVRDAGKEKP